MVFNATQVRPAPLACGQCRSKHSKCDNGTPKCSRCDAEGLQCVYKPSRRGYGRRNATGRYPEQRTPEASGPITPITVSPANSHHTYPNSGFSAATDDTQRYPGSQRAREREQSDTLHLIPASGSSTSTSSLQTIDGDLFIKAYYLYFHPAHPLLVPRSHFNRQAYPEYLQWTVYLVGRQCVGQPLASVDVDGVAMRMLVAEKDEMTVCRVQALVIYAITLHSLHRPHQALECIQRAVQIANGLGLNRPDFASSSAAPGSVEEESIRRTWWELYIVEAYLAALHRRLSLFSEHQGPYPALPGRETSYNAGTCDANHASLPLFENRAFASDHQNVEFSTYCYRVAAARIIHRVLDLFANEQAQSDVVQVVDIAIASWKYYLPDRSEAESEDLKEIDPLLFQAQYLVHSASILLHFPRSDLPSTVPTAAEIACVRNHTQRIPGSLQHSRKAIEASKEIASLAASLSSTDTCSPLFICALILACIVQLAASAIHCGMRDVACLSQHRDHIVLLLGVLKDMSGRWPVARSALQPLRLVADTIFGGPQKQSGMMPTPALTNDSFASTSDIHAGVSWFDLFAVDDLMADFMGSASESAL